MEDFYWFQVGPPPKHLWAWSRQELRDQLRVGSILMTYDCGYIRVDEITDEGVISRSPFSDRHLWTWAALEGLECIICKPEQVVAADVNGPFLTERGGMIDAHWLENAPALDPEDSLAADFDDTLLNKEIARELLRLAPGSWLEIHLHAHLSAEAKDWSFHLSVETVDGGERVSPSQRLQRLVFALHQLSGRRQGVAWNGLDFVVEVRSESGYRYEAQFSYA